MFSLLAGCTWCPDGYRACAGQCWRLLDENTAFWPAAYLCEAESIKHSGGNKSYIAIPSPRNNDEDNCAYQFSAGWGVWLGYIEQNPNIFVSPGTWLDYKFRHYISYSPWAPGEPNWGG